MKNINIEAFTDFLLTFRNKKILFCDKNSKLFSLASLRVAELFENNFSTVLKLTTDALDNVRKMKDSPASIVENLIAKASLLLVMFMFHPQ